MEKPILVLCTVPDDEIAPRLARVLVELLGGIAFRLSLGR